MPSLELPFSGGHAFGDTGELDTLTFLNTSVTGMLLDVSGGPTLNLNRGDDGAMANLVGGRISGASNPSTPLIQIDGLGSDGYMSLDSGGYIAWSNSDTDATQTKGTFISRASAGIVQIGATLASADGTLNLATLNATTAITLSEGTAADTPASTKIALYGKADGLLYSKDDAGTETLVSVPASSFE